MIGNITQGSGFSGLLQYLYTGDKEKPNPARVAWTDFQHLMPSDDPERLAGILRSTAKLYPNEPGKPVIHISVSWAPEERPTEEQMRQVAGQVLERMELGNHQAVIVAHRDADHPHLHIAANQVSEDGTKLWDAWKSKSRLEAVMRELEREHGFHAVPGRLAPVPGRERPGRALLTRSEHLEALRKGSTASPAEQRRVREQIRRQFRQSHSWAELEDSLATMGGLRLERRGRGLVVTDGERKIKASRIDRQGSKGKLEERFGQSFESWLEQKRQLWQLAGKIRHHQQRKDRLTHRYRGAQVPEVVQRVQRIKGRIDATIQALQGDLRAVYRPVQARLTRKGAEKLLGAAGVPKISRPPTAPARAAMTALNLVSRVLPPGAGKVLKATIRVADALVRERGGR